MKRNKILFKSFFGAVFIHFVTDINSLMQKNKKIHVLIKNFIEKTSLFFIRNSRIIIKNSRIIIKDSKMFIEGSMTVEAAVVLPLFMIFFINLACSVNMIRLHSNLCVALWDTGNNLSVYGSLITDNMRNLGRTGHDATGEDEEEDDNDDYDEDGNDNDENLLSLDTSEDETLVENDIIRELGDLAVSYTYVKNKIINFLGEDYLDNSPLAEGCDSLQFYESEIFTDDDTIEINLTYKVSSLIDFDGLFTMRMCNRYYSHLWNGYDVCQDSDEGNSSGIVFVTNDSSVYHTSTSCTYLRLSVRAVLYSNLSNERNSEGRSYSPCLFCAIGRSSTVAYVCDEGCKYHLSRNCPALRRSYSAVSLSSVENTHRPCSRCGDD